MNKPSQCPLTPVKAIRVFCLACMGGSKRLVRECNNPDCSLYPYRLGTNPNRAGIGGRRSQNPN